MQCGKNNNTMGTGLMLGQKDHQDPIKACGMSVGEGLHALQTADCIAQYFVSNYLSLTLKTEILRLPFPLQVFLSRRIACFSCL